MPRPGNLGLNGLYISVFYSVTVGVSPDTPYIAIFFLKAALSNGFAGAPAFCAAIFSR
jgi:hypothetical protein